MEKKDYFNVNKNTTVKNNNAARMLRKSDNKSINLGLDINVDPIHIKKEDVDVHMDDCAIDMTFPSLEVEGQDVVIPVDKDQVIKAGKLKVKFDLGGGRMNQTSAKSAYEMMGGLLNMISDMWDQKVKEDKPVDGFDPVE
jgi:hypothetical protein